MDLGVQGGHEMTVKEAIAIMEKRKNILEKSHQSRDAEALETLIEVAKKEIKPVTKEDPFERLTKELSQGLAKNIEFLSKEPQNQ